MVRILKYLKYLLLFITVMMFTACSDFNLEEILGGQTENGTEEEEETDDTGPSDTTPPVPGNSGALSAKGISASAVRLEWTKAEDDQTQQVFLSYRVYYSTNGAIENSSQLSLKGIAAEDWTYNQNMFQFSDLDDALSYHFNVVVRDDSNNLAMYNGASATTTDITPPEAGSNGMIYASERETNYLIVNWYPATDVGTAQSNLLYRVMISSNTNDYLTNISPQFCIENLSNSFDSNTYWSNQTEWTVSNLTAASNYQFIVYVKDLEENTNLYQITNLRARERVLPEISNQVISFSNIHTNGVTLYWDKAEDNFTVQSNLAYRVYYSLSNDLTNTSTVISNLNGTISAFTGWSNDLTLMTVDGLQSGRRYYLNVLVKDEDGNTTNYLSTNVLFYGWRALEENFLKAYSVDHHLQWLYDTDNTAFLLYPDTNDAVLKIKKRITNVWTDADVGLNFSNDAARTVFRLDASNRLYLGTVTNGTNTNSYFTLHLFDQTSNWNQTNSNFVMNTGSNLSLAFGTNDQRPYVLYQDTNQLVSRIRVKKMLTDGWTNIADPGFTAGSTNAVISGNPESGELVSAVSDISNGLSVKVFNGSNWSEISETNLYSGPVKNIIIDWLSNNILVLAFVDSGLGDKPAVKKYQSGQWQTLGSTGISDSAVEEMNLTVSVSNDLYLSYIEQGTNSLKQIIVKQFDSGSWEMKGDIPVSESGIAEHRLSVNSNRCPSVLYSQTDGNGYRDLTVREYVPVPE